MLLFYCVQSEKLSLESTLQSKVVQPEWDKRKMLQPLAGMVHALTINARDRERKEKKKECMQGKITITRALYVVSSRDGLRDIKLVHRAKERLLVLLPRRDGLLLDERAAVWVNRLDRHPEPRRNRSVVGHVCLPPLVVQLLDPRWFPRTP